MSTGEVLDAYIRGEIGRRTLIRYLVARGVSLESAANHAVALQWQVGIADDLDDADDEDAGDREDTPVVPSRKLEPQLRGWD